MLIVITPVSCPNPAGVDARVVKVIFRIRGVELVISTTADYHSTSEAGARRGSSRHDPSPLSTKFEL